MITPIEEFVVAAHMRALMQMFEGDGAEHNRILYQAVISFDMEAVGQRCREIDAADADGVFAIFDLDAITDGPLHVGMCMRDREMVRLDLGHLWEGRAHHAVLVANRSHLRVDGGRFVGVRCADPPLMAAAMILYRLRAPRSRSRRLVSRSGRA